MAHFTIIDLIFHMNWHNKWCWLNAVWSVIEQKLMLQFASLPSYNCSSIIPKEANLFFHIHNPKRSTINNHSQSLSIDEKLISWQWHLIKEPIESCDYQCIELKPVLSLMLLILTWLIWFIRLIGSPFWWISDWL